MHLFMADIGLPFIPDWRMLRPFVGELWVIATIVAVLLTPFFTPRRSNLACAAVSFVGLLVAFAFILFTIGLTDGGAGVHFRGLLVSDHFAVLWKLMLLLFVMGIILMWLSTTASSMHEGDGPEFFTLLLGATLGMMLMASTTNLLMLLIAVEMASLPSYVLAGFRKTHRLGAEASLKYVLFGAVTSAVMTYGLSLLYGLYGTLNIEQLAGHLVPGGSEPLLYVAIFALVVGIGFKISAVPFHFWCPDVFEGASIDVSAFLSVASKGAALVLLLRVLMTLAASVGYHDAAGVSLTGIAWVVGIIGAITCTVGNTAAFLQNNIKRLLAYSSIAHAGYMTCALSLLVKHGESLQDPANQTAQVLLFYLAAYLFMNLGAFTIAGLVWRATGGENLADYRGLGRRQPVLAGAMFCCLVSLIGLPPFAGFLAKWNVLWVLFQNGGWWWALIIVIGVNTVLSAFYYFRIVKAMYLQGSDEPAFFPNPLGTAIGVACALILFAMLVAYNPLDRLTHHYANVYLGGSSSTVAGDAPAKPQAAPPQAAAPAAVVLRGIAR
jgi:NADH-quinone oxidoreductase subunit N